MIRRRAEWALHHPVSAMGALLRRLERHPGLPVGHSARGRRLLRALLPDDERALVVGPRQVVRQALARATLDVVGSNPDDVDVTVVSEAIGAGSLPRRWDCVIVTERAPGWDRLVAAAGACRPGGLLVVLGRPRRGRITAPPAEMEDLAHRAQIRLIMPGGTA